jgi:hypothetical protein
MDEHTSHMRKEKNIIEVKVERTLCFCIALFFIISFLFSKEK